MRALYTFFLENIREIEGLSFLAKPASAVIIILIILFLAWIGHYITRQLILRIVTRITRRTKTTWDDILVKRKVFRNLAHIVPAIILYYSADFSFPPIHQPVSELSQATIDMLSKDYYFSLDSFLTNTAKIY